MLNPLDKKVQKSAFFWHKLIHQLYINIAIINLWNSCLIYVSKNNAEVILQFQSLPWQLLGIIFAKVSWILCWLSALILAH